MYNYNLITPPSYNTRRYFNLCSEADRSRLNLPQVTSIVTSVSVRECMSVHKNISGTSGLSFKFSLHVTHGHGSVILWQPCNLLHTSGFMADVFFHNWLYAGMSLPLQWRRCMVRSQANAPAALYWLHHVGTKTRRVLPSCKGCRGQSLQCTTALLNWDHCL